MVNIVAHSVADGSNFKISLVQARRNRDARIGPLRPYMSDSAVWCARSYRQGLSGPICLSPLWVCTQLLT